MKKQCIVILLFATSIFLSSCSLLSPISTPVTQSYLLVDPSHDLPMTARSSSNISIVVAKPSAPTWLSSNRMVYQQHVDQMNYFAENQWASPPSEMLQPIVVHALQQSGLYQAVISAPFSGNYDQRLEIRLIDMQQQFWQKPSVYQMAWQVQLIDNHRQRVIASTRISAIVPTVTDNPQGGVTAANEATRQLLRQLVYFCSQYLK